MSSRVPPGVDGILRDNRGFVVRALTGDGNIWCRVFRCSFWPAALFYSYLMIGRRSLYRIGVFRSRRASVPTISIGNLTCGGTGKTSMVQWVCRVLKDKGIRPAVLSRGYALGRSISPDESDESKLLKNSSEGAIHIADPNRVRAANRAVAEHGAECVVLDDGFQHLRMRRDLDIVLIDAMAPFGPGGTLPAGILREPRSALKWADLFVITHSDLCSSEELGAVRRALSVEAPEVPIVEAVHEPRALVEVGGGGRREVSWLRSRKVYAFCALGNPWSFLGTLRSADAQVVGASIFRDHYVYRPSDARELEQAALAAGAEAVLCTTKDAVKIDSVWRGKSGSQQLQCDREEVPQLLQLDTSRGLSRRRFRNGHFPTIGPGGPDER